MSIFLRSSMCFRGPHLCSKIPKINIQGLELGRTQCKGMVAGNPWFTWCNPGVGITTRPVYTVCASAVISPLRQWLVSYAKTRFKMCHTFKHLFICNTFCCRLILLSLSLYTELALVCCTNPNNVNCFGTIFPNLNFVFASNLSRSILNPTNTEVAQLSNKDPLSVLLHPPRLGSNQKQRCGSGFAK